MNGRRRVASTKAAPRAGAPALEAAAGSIDRANSGEIRVPGKECVLAALLMVVLIATAFFNVVFLNRSIVATDNYNPLDSRFTERNYGKDFVPPSVWTRRGLIPYPNFHDPAGAWWGWEPSAIFLQRALRRGELPFWDPYVGGGTPSMANLVPTYLFPPYLLIVFLGYTSFLKNLYFLSLLFAAGFFTYLFLRKHGLSYIASFVGATCFLFCGSLVTNINSLIGEAAACLPIALYLTRRFLDHPSRPRTAALAAGYAAISLASFPPVLLSIFTFTVVYAVSMLWGSPAPPFGASRRKATARFVSAGTLAIGLVAFYYLPGFALLRDAPQVREIYRTAGMESLPYLSFFQLFSPVLMGAERILKNPPMPEPFHYQLAYVGIVPILLACLAWRRSEGHRGPLFLVTLVSAAVLTLKMFGVAPIQWLGRLPGFRTTHIPVYFGALLNFLIAVLAAIGVEALVRKKVSLGRALLPVGIAVVVLSTLWQIAERKGVLWHTQAGHWIGDWRFRAVLAALVGATVMIGASARLSDHARRNLLAAIALLVAVEGFRNTFYPRQYRWDVWRNPVPYVRKLLELKDSGRVLPIGVFPANTNSAFEIFSMDSLMPMNPPRVFDFYKKYFAPRPEAPLRTVTMLPPDPILDCAGIRYLVVGRAAGQLGQTERAGYEVFYEDAYVRIFRRPSTPRYYFTSNYRVLPRARSLDALAEPFAEREILLESFPGRQAVPNDSNDPVVQIREFGPNRYVLAANAPRPGFVYGAESFFPGWRVRVNGKSAMWRPANYAFRAVEVPKGPALIEASYWPPGLTDGLAVSLVSLVILAFTAQAERRPRK